MERLIGGRYKLGQKLGCGAFGEIYYGIILEYQLGMDLKTKEEVAIKLVK